MSVYRCVLSGIRASKLEGANETRRNNFVSVIDKVCKDINGWSKVLIPSNEKLLAINKKIDEIVDGKNNNKDKIESMMEIINSLNVMGVSKGKDGSMQLAMKNFSFKETGKKFIISRMDNDEQPFVDKKARKGRSRVSGKKSEGFNGGENSGEGKYTDTFEIKVMQRDIANPGVSKTRDIQIYFVEDSLFSAIPEFNEVLTGGCGCGSDTISGGQFSDLRQIYDIIRVMANAESIPSNSEGKFKSDLVTTCMEFCNGFYATIYGSDPSLDLYNELLFLKCGCPIRSLLNIIYFLYNPEQSNLQEELKDWNFSPCPVKVNEIWERQVPSSADCSGETLVEKYKSKIINDKNYASFVSRFFKFGPDNISDENMNFKKLKQFEYGNAKAYERLLKMEYKNCKWIQYVEFQFMTIVASCSFEISEFSLSTQLDMNSCLPYSCDTTDCGLTKASRNAHIEQYLQNFK
jgi:hypothetical protein